MQFNRLSLIIIFLILFFGWSYILYLNPGKVETTLPVIGSFTVPVIVYITIPIILLGMLLAFFFMGLKDYIKDFIESRKFKQKERIENLFTEGVRQMNSDKPLNAIPIFRKI